jgi:hypothetical protein
MADGGVMVSGTEVTTCCWGSIRPNELDSVALNLVGSARSSGETRSGEMPEVVMVMVVVEVKEELEKPTKGNASSVWSRSNALLLRTIQGENGSHDRASWVDTQRARLG